MTLENKVILIIFRSFNDSSSRVLCSVIFKQGSGCIFLNNFLISETSTKTWKKNVMLIGSSPTTNFTDPNRAGDLLSLPH